MNRSDTDFLMDYVAQRKERLQELEKEFPVELGTSGNEDFQEFMHGTKPILKFVLVSTGGDQFNYFTSFHSMEDLLQYASEVAQDETFSESPLLAVDMITQERYALRTTVTAEPENSLAAVRKYLEERCLSPDQIQTL